MLLILQYKQPTKPKNQMIQGGSKSHHKDYCWMCGQIYNSYAGPHDCFMMHSSCGAGREDLCFAKGGLPGPGVQY